MKNLIIYTVSAKETQRTSKQNPTTLTAILKDYFHAQIDNSLDMGWKKEDIFLATNFDFEYRGVSTFKVKGSSDVYVSKLQILAQLFQDKIITDSVWLHDLDSWQNTSFEPPTFKDIGVVHYVSAGLKNKEGAINGGSLFYKPSALDMIQKMVNYKIDKQSSTDEGPITNICKYTSDEYRERVTTLNNTYNVGQTWLPKRYGLAEKPIRVIHFHPVKRWLQFCEGRNKLRIQIVSDRLRDLLAKYFLNGRLTGKVARYNAKRTGIYFIKKRW